PGDLVRRTTRTFLHEVDTNYLAYNIVNKVLNETVLDAANAEKAKTKYEYDTTSLANAAGAPHHDDPNYSTDFLLRGNASVVSRWRNTDGVWLDTIYNYDTLGNIASIKNPRGKTTTYDYADRWANTSCAPSSNSHAYVTQVTNALNQRVQL